MAKCDADEDVEVQLNEEEKKAFGEFMRKQAASEVKLWEPWWNSRKEFATTKVIDITKQADLESAGEVNMNRFGEDCEDGEGEESDDGNFEDIEGEEEVEVDQSEELPDTALEHLYQRRLKAIPEITSLLKTKAPAATMPFLITSNVISFLFYSRYYNGSLLDSDPLRLTANLTAQLLSKESQERIEADFSSAYIDAMKSLVQNGKLSAT